MKKNYIILVHLILLSILISNAQNTLSFTETNKKSIKLKDNFKAYKIITINDDFNKIASKEVLNIQLTKVYNYILKENKLLSTNYKITINGANGIEEKNLSEIGFDGKYFTNEDISTKKQLILSIYENAYTIYIKDSKTEFYIEPLKKYDASAKATDYIYYNVSDAIIPEKMDCGFKESSKQNVTKSNYEPQTGGCKTVEIAFSVDYTMYNTYNSISGTINRTLEVLNLSEANYSIANGISDDVHFKVVQHYIVTCNTCNYWPTTLAIYDNYAKLGTYASRMFNNHYDLKIHWQNQGGPGSVVGLGSYGICSSADGNGFGRAVVKNYATNTNYIRCILSHEIGHNFGCEHNSEIMRATVSGSNSWSATSIETINNSLLTYVCFSDCDTDACDNKKVEDAVVTLDIPTNTINVSWLAEEGIDFKVRLYDFNADAWTAYTTLAYPTNAITYNYTQVHCTDKYKIDIVPVCNAINGISAQIAFNIDGNVDEPVLVFGYLSEDALCRGEVSYFTVSAIDEGTTPIYQWKINGIDVGANEPNFSTDALQNNDVLSCHLTSSATCVSSPYASVSITVSVEEPTLLSVIVNTTETTICEGDEVTLTAVGTNISGRPYYSWRLNGGHMQDGGAGGGQSGATITVIPANDGDVYTCILYDGNACHTSGTGQEDNGATSNEITITILNPCTLSNNEFEVLGLEYYPNPVKNEFTIKANEEILDITVYNLLGQKIIYKKINGLETVLNVSNLVKSAYFIRIKAKSQTETVKIIKK